AFQLAQPELVVAQRPRPVRRGLGRLAHGVVVGEARAKRLTLLRELVDLQVELLEGVEEGQWFHHTSLERRPCQVKVRLKRGVGSGILERMESPIRRQYLALKQRHP